MSKQSYVIENNMRRLLVLNERVLTLYAILLFFQTPVYYLASGNIWTISIVATITVFSIMLMRRIAFNRLSQSIKHNIVDLSSKDRIIFLDKTLNLMLDSTNMDTVTRYAIEDIVVSILLILKYEQGETLFLTDVMLRNLSHIALLSKNISLRQTITQLNSRNQ